MSSDPKIQKKSGYHHGDLRAQLIEATRQLVEEKGPDHFSVSQACRVAGVSTAAPYRHFRNKDEMLRSVCEEAAERHFSQMKAALEGLPEGDLERIIAMGRVYVGFAQAEPSVFRLMFSWPHQSGAMSPEDAAAPPTKTLVETEVAKLLGKSEIDSDVKLRATMLWTFVHGLSFLLIDGKAKVCEFESDIEVMLSEAARRVMA
ncbi:TetR/AcrR family transcriptional regulator [Fluviibacterium sp. S390]|uniref:TetR/AcrR family transcriptional regulator n=1 Tax=Fluviibacterium sp. S390 TaxID=3415139 RepID=UPI003C79DBC5